MIETHNLVKIIAVCYLYFLVTLLWRKRHLYWRAAQVAGPWSFPVIGSSYVFYGSVLEGFFRRTGQFGEVYKLWLGNKLVFVVSRPEDVRVVLNTALDKVDGMKYLRPVFGNGLLLLPAAEWKVHRKLIGVAFKQRVLNSFVEVFAKHARILVGNVDRYEGYFDLFPILSECTLDFVAETTLGSQLDVRKNLLLWTSRLSEISYKRITNPLLQVEWIWKMTSWSRESKMLSQEVSNFLNKIISAKRCGSKGEQFALLDLFFELENDDDDAWTEEDSIEEVRTILIAAGDATALTMGYVFMMLGMHQEIQMRVYSELVAVCGNRSVTSEDIPQLGYLDLVIKETLRLFPIGPIIGRYLVRDLVLERHTFPKGSSVLVPTICMHRNADLWPEPLKFDPDRFSETEGSTRHPYSYLPFSKGPRNCLGFKYAEVAMKAVLATILRHYIIVGTPYESVSAIKLKVDVATKCVHGQKVKLQRRAE